jgi:hypothetical protein
MGNNERGNGFELGDRVHNEVYGIGTIMDTYLTTSGKRNYRMYVDSDKCVESVCIDFLTHLTEWQESQKFDQLKEALEYVIGSYDQFTHCVNKDCRRCILSDDKNNCIFSVTRKVIKNIEAMK